MTTLSDLVKSIKDKSNVSDFYFTRKLLLDNSQYTSWHEMLWNVFFINLKGRINNLLDGYQPYKSIELHTDHLAAQDWLLVEVDKEKRTITPKLKFVDTTEKDFLT